MRGWTGCVAAGVALLCVSGCATVRPPSPPRSAAGAENLVLKQTGTLLTMVRQVGWKEVEDLQPLLQAQADADFPGVAALAADLRSVAKARNPVTGVPPIDAAQLIEHNPHFWNAYYEIAPGDPLIALLHVGLLLTAGEVVQADHVATLEINFGRMELDYRKELVRLDAHAQLVIQVSHGDEAGRVRLRQQKAYGVLAGRARDALAVWPENPDALADLATALRDTAGGGSPAVDSPAGRLLAALREADPLFPVDAAIAGPEPEALRTARGCWRLIDEEKATGDDGLLERFSAAAQAAGIDDLALVARSLLAGWTEGSRPLDENFCRESLQRLVPPNVAADICAGAFADGRQWIGLNTQDDVRPVNLEGISVHPQLEQRLTVQIAETSYWIESGLSQGADLAANYGERGEAWAQLLQKNQAVADLEHSLKLDPANNDVRYSLAVALSDGGDFSAADRIFAEAAKRVPRSAQESEAWGNHLFKQGRFAAAEAAYSRAARLDPSFAYARIMLHLARIRQGRPGDARSDAHIEQRDPWGAALLDFLAGRVGEKGLFARLEPQGGLRYSEEECELYFVLAEIQLSRGEIAEARRSLHSCLGTGITSFVEYAMAWHELRRLDLAHPPPVSKGSTGGDVDDQPA